MSALSTATQVQPPAVRCEALGATIPARYDIRINPRMIAFHAFLCPDALTSRLLSLILDKACQPRKVDVQH
jgi:hypothetical protein